MSKTKKRDTISQEVLNCLRRKMNLTLKEIASLAGVKKEELSDIAKGKSKFTLWQLSNILQGTGKKMSELITR